MFFLFKKINRRYLLLILVLALAAVLLAVWQYRPDRLLHLYFLNVGQGDAVLIVTPANRQILIDGGPDDAVVAQLSGVLPFYDRSIDMVVLTHPHADHLSGLLEVLKRYRVEKMLFTGVGREAGEYARFLRLLDQKGVEEIGAAAGQKIDFGDGVSVAVLWPPEGFESGDLNETSIVSFWDYNEFEALLTGDAPEPILSALDLEAAEVLKVPHHGAKDALSAPFLERLRPALAVITVGENQFGHPTAAVLDLLRRFGVVVKRTDLDGSVEVVSDGKKWWIR